MNMKNTILSGIIGLATLTCMSATESQTQPEVGKPAPDFSLTTGDGSQVSLKDYRGKWVVLYFYPKDFTSGSNLESPMAAQRKSIDCRDYPSEKNCSLKISGTEEEVLDAAVEHAASVHGHGNTPELREQIKSMLKDERD